MVNWARKNSSDPFTFLEKKTDLTPSSGEMSAYHADAADGVTDVALVEVNEQSHRKRFLAPYLSPLRRAG
jgi:hypothetical protein